ncbi:MAG: hypothetical protein ABI675_17405 [Chitinophagaceae bacterium]
MFWFRPHRFFNKLKAVAPGKEKVQREAHYIDSLWLVTFIILVFFAYPAALLLKNTFGKFALWYYVISYFIFALLTAILFGFLSYYAQKKSGTSDKDDTRIMSVYAALFGHALVIATLLLVYLPLCFVIPLFELLFHSEYVDAVSVPIVVVILRTFVYFFVAQAMHENNQKPG